jgi:hypothetical protein
VPQRSAASPGAAASGVSGCYTRTARGPHDRTLNRARGDVQDDLVATDDEESDVEVPQGYEEIETSDGTSPQQPSMRHEYSQLYPRARRRRIAAAGCICALSEHAKP